MEDKFCLKSRKELDEIRKRKAEAKKQVNEISNELANKVVKKRGDRLHNAQVKSDVRKPETMATLKDAEDKHARALRLRKANRKVAGMPESKINEDESGYLNDDEIAGFYKDFNIKSINNLEKKSSVWNGDEHFYYTGDIVIEFPNADDDYDEFAHEETYDNFIAHKEDGTGVAFDNWYPDEVYNQLSSAITKAIRDKFPPEEKDVEGIMRVGKKGDIMYRNNKTGKYYIARSGKEKPAYGKTFDNEEDLLAWAGEVGLLESKINEISDETVYSAVAKAQDKALKSLRKDPDKRNFLRDANKLNNIYNAGLRREWRKKGLKNPVGMSAKQLGKVWDKDYEPVKNEYDNQLKKRNKIDAFGNEKNESLTAKKALIKSKTILEEYGEYQGDLNFEEIARQLEYGNTYGSTYETEWGEVEINGTPISDLLKTNEVIDWVLHELSYPVRDGHAYYDGLDLLFNNYSYEDTIDHTDEDVIADLVALGFDETEVREMPVIKDPEYQGDISDERFKEIETWINYDINYKEPEEDEEYDESLSKADKRLTVPNRPRLKSLADDIVDLGVETAKSVGHALTGDIFRKRRKPVVSEARLKELANKGKTEMKNKNFTASEALELSKKHLEERKTHSHRRKTMVIPFSYENPDQHSLADRISHKLVITKEQDGTFSWSETSNDESGKGFKSAKEAFDNAVSAGEFPLEDYDGFQLDAKVDLATFFNESKISKSAQKNESMFKDDTKVKVVKGYYSGKTGTIVGTAEEYDPDTYETTNYCYMVKIPGQGIIQIDRDNVIAESAQKNESAETRWGYDSYGYVEIEIPVDYIHSIAQSGDNAEAVKEALNDPFIANQFKDYSDEAIEKCFDSIGFDMTDAEVAGLTRREKEEYILWDFAWHLLDDMDESKINEVSREKANKVVNADQQYDAIVNYNINKPETVKALHNAEDKLDRALRLRRSSTKLRKNESMFNKYGELVDPKEWKNKEARGLNEAKSNEVNIFLTNLGKYNEGELVGEWVKLPVDDFQPILDRIGINDEYEEWFITDYEAPFEINEYDNIEELNDIAREIQDFNSTQLEVLDAYKDNGYDMRDAIDKVIENDYFYLEGDTEEDLAYSYIDMAGSFEDAVSKEDKQYYFDYEAYGRDLVLGGDYSYVDDVVDLNSFADKDTAIAIFGDYGEDLPSEEDIAKYKKWIEIYNNYTDEQEEELAKQGIEVSVLSIYVDGVAYDVETLEQVVDEDYEVQSGYKDDDGNIVNVISEKELGEYVVDDLLGGLDQMSEDELERYFDYAWWGENLSYDFHKTDNGWVQLY